MQLVSVSILAILAIRLTQALPLFPSLRVSKPRTKLDWYCFGTCIGLTRFVEYQKVPYIVFWQQSAECPKPEVASPVQVGHECIWTCCQVESKKLNSAEFNRWNKTMYVLLGAFTLAEAKQKGRLVFGKEFQLHQLFLLMLHRPLSTLVIFPTMLAFKLSRQVPKNKDEDKEASEPAEAWPFWDMRKSLNFWVARQLMPKVKRRLKRLRWMQRAFLHCSRKVLSFVFMGSKSALHLPDHNLSRAPKQLALTKKYNPQCSAELAKSQDSASSFKTHAGMRNWADDH